MGCPPAGKKQGSIIFISDARHDEPGQGLLCQSLCEISDVFRRPVPVCRMFTRLAQEFKQYKDGAAGTRAYRSYPQLRANFKIPRELSLYHFLNPEELLTVLKPGAQ